MSYIIPYIFELLQQLYQQSHHNFRCGFCWFPADSSLTSLFLFKTHSPFTSLWKNSVFFWFTVNPKRQRRHQVELQKNKCNLLPEVCISASRIVYFSHYIDLSHEIILEITIPCPLQCAYFYLVYLYIDKGLGKHYEVNLWEGCGGDAWGMWLNVGLPVTTGAL